MILRTRGFTLAEVLIALALLGVVAAFTIPKVMQANQDQQRNLVIKETLAVIASAVREGAMTGEIRSTNPSNLSACTMATYLDTKLNAIKVCTVAETEGCWDNAKGTMPESNENGYVLANGAVITGLNGVCGDNGFAIDWNGTNPPNTVGEDQLALQICGLDTPGVCGSRRKAGVIFPNTGSAVSRTLYLSIYQ